MKKFWMIYTQGLVRFETKEEAVAEAKRKALQNTGGDPIYVLESIIIAQRLVPEIETFEMR